MYISGVNNYRTHEEGLRCFYRCRTKVALILCKDGTSNLNWLQDEPMYAGQVEFNPDPSKVEIKWGEAV